MQGKKKKQYIEISARNESVDIEKRTIDLVISTVDKDREGDIVEPSGLDFTNFLKNPVILWAHKYSQPPIGRAIALSVNAKDVEARVEFAETEFAEEIFKLYVDGFLNGWSIGFIPTEWERIQNERGELEGFHITKAEVLEFSAVPIPANADTLSKQERLALIKTKELKDYLEKYFEGLTQNDEEPSWEEVNQKQLPAKAFANLVEMDKEKRETWKGAHHGVNDGTMFLHRGALKAACKDPEASKAVQAHLRVHCRSIGETEGLELCVDSEGRILTREVGEENFIEFTPVPEFKLAPGAFKKSVEERGEDGKIPVDIYWRLKSPGYQIIFEPLQVTEHTITEAKICRIQLALKDGEPKPPVKPGRTDDTSGGAAGKHPEPQKLHSFDAEIAEAEAEAELSAAELSLFHLSEE